MALFVRIYYNAVFGGLGGLLGWMLFGVFGDKNAPDDRVMLQVLLGGALIGGMIGYLVVGVDAVRDRSVLRFCRLASYGVALGAVGGALGMFLGEQVNYLLVALIGPNLLGGMFARGLGWMVLGLAVGMSEGVAARSLGKLSYGTLGGAIGGFVGGALFGLLYLKTLDRAGTAALWGALGLVILGACIGALSALVQAVLQPASLRVLRGWQEGREYALDKPSCLLGRDEHADIALFRDMKVEKRHAFIRRDGDRYLLVNNKAPPEHTLVNGEPVPVGRELHDGDRIQLGNVVLRFQMRAAQAKKSEDRRQKAEDRMSGLF
jgi:MFS family permease